MSLFRRGQRRRPLHHARPLARLEPALDPQPSTAQRRPAGLLIPSWLPRARVRNLRRLHRRLFRRPSRAATSVHLVLIGRDWILRSMGRGVLLVDVASLSVDVGGDGWICKMVFSAREFLGLIVDGITYVLLIHMCICSEMSVILSFLFCFSFCVKCYF